MSKLKLFITAVLLFTSLLANNISFAQEYVSIDEKITSFTSKIFINTDGTIDVTEDIVYDFGPNQRHGIIREIPTTKVNIDGKKYKLGITNISVANEKFTVQKSNEFVEIKIGDINTEVSGKHTYSIRYRVSGAITYFSDHDELYWNITGTSWEVPIGKALASISLNSQVVRESIQTLCYTGKLGSTEQNCTMVTVNSNSGDNYVNTFESIGSLQPEENLTIVYGFPKGIVAIIEPETYSDQSWMIFIGILLTQVFSFGTIFGMIYVYFKENANLKRKQKIVAAWFEAPKNDKLDHFTPAETAALVNNKADAKNISATLIHLAQRGYLKIVVEDKKNNGIAQISFLRKNSWQNDSGINDFEKEILDLIFDNGQKAIVTVKELKKSDKLAMKLPDIYTKILTSLYKNKLYKVNPHKFDIFTGIMLSIVTFVSAPFFGWPFAIFAWIKRRQALPRTDLGIEKYSEAKSLLNFLNSQKDQLEFQAHNQLFFEKLLPYATAFGVEKIWAKRFSDLQFVQTDWYEGSNINSLNMINSISFVNSSFRGMTTTRSSSGFSSGFSGGSSGGGGGGGGGRSW